MDWTCPHCTRTMQLVSYVGQWTLECPRQNDGQHPVVRIITADTTAPQK